MTDKLAEAIATYDTREGLIFDRQFDIIAEAARAYNDLPVVDVNKTKRISDGFGINQSDGWNLCLDHLRATYPNGLRWK
jgi:hypothetical protein